MLGIFTLRTWSPLAALLSLIAPSATISPPSASGRFSKSAVLLACLFVAIFMLAPPAVAEPVTFEGAPTFNAPLTGPVDGYRLYDGCDTGTQAKGPLVDGAYSSGKPISIAGDTTSPPVLCIVAYNTSCGQASCEGPFTAFTPSVTGALPGAIENLVPGPCTVVSGSANQYNCTFTLVP